MKKKKNGNGKRTKTKTMRIGVTGSNRPARLGYIIPIRHTRATRMQSHQLAEVNCMAKKKGKKQSKKKGADK
ncbi:MAG: hypothetical protein JSV58_05670 [Candidatus Bathyarchaeota archaeon]|nr:MAG: hypothetical protein JSV58_05670 [Candidatus Bathyarchaeota archaeon]